MRSPTQRNLQPFRADAFVVDDDGDACGSLADFLTRVGIPSLAATDGWTALKLIAEGARPGVVISDLRMPELDGVEFATRLHALDASIRPEIIFLSGAAAFDDAVAAIRLGAADMLTKPAQPQRLVQAVKDALLRRQIRLQSDATARPSTAVAASAPQPRKRALLDELRAIRRLRSRYFATQLFSDPNWEMLLDLYDATLVGQDVTTTSLGAASGIPLTTALRRMDVLQEHGLIERAEDLKDRRRILVRLTPAGLEAVDSFFDSYAALPRSGIGGSGSEGSSSP